MYVATMAAADVVVRTPLCCVEMNCARMFDIEPRTRACAVPLTNKEGMMAVYRQN